jgi:Cyclin M transmembrane N-terminal domain
MLRRRRGRRGDRANAPPVVAIIGAKALGRSAGESAEPLQAALADVPRYLSVVLLIRVASEICAAVLVAAVLATWLGINWKAFLITAVAMTLATYLLAGLIPRRIGRRAPVKVASAAATVLRPVIRLLGPENLTGRRNRIGTVLVQHVDTDGDGTGGGQHGGGQLLPEWVGDMRNGSRTVVKGATADQKGSAADRKGASADRKGASARRRPVEWPRLGLSSRSHLAVSRLSACRSHGRMSARRDRS